jgi:hypothetical protein
VSQRQHATAERSDGLNGSGGSSLGKSRFQNRRVASGFSRTKSVLKQLNISVFDSAIRYVCANPSE